MTARKTKTSESPELAITDPVETPFQNPADIVSLQVAETVSDLVTDAVKVVMDRVPDLIQAAIVSEFNSPARRDALQAMQQQMQAAGSGAAENFLSQKLLPLQPASSPKLLAISEPSNELLAATTIEVLSEPIL